jgi:molybdenum cofactor cytidylyltransferase
MKKRYVAIILAAGRSERFGSQKLLCKIDGLTIIERVLRTFLLVNEIERILVILGHEKERVEKIVKSYPVIPVYNPSYNEGMSSSIKAGVLMVEDDDEVFIHLADKPFIREGLIREMIDASVKKWPHIVVPVWEGRKGHPVLIGPGSYLKNISDIEGDVGLKWVIEREKENVIYLAADESILIDIDSEEDLENLRKMGVNIEES